MDEGLTLEAGVDRAAQVLSRYDPAAATWNVTKASEFWDSVRLARSLGRDGASTTVAVIDGAFDMTLPALRRHELAWPAAPDASTVHGNVVALLILEVAPSTSLVLYPVFAGGQLQPDLVVRAINDARLRDMSIVNLSLGQARPFGDVFRSADFYDPTQFWPDMADDDLQFWVSERLAAAPKSEWLTLTDDPVSTAATEAASDGLMVIAAAGNYDGYVFSPALLPDVFSVGFHREVRSVDSAMEQARSEAPTYLQSELVDFGIIQPSDVLGSSFATPLLSGLACLMTSRSDLGAYRETARLAGMASQLMVLAGELPYAPRRYDVIDRLYNRAVNDAPHRHHADETIAPCPECGFFAFLAYNDYGLFKLNTRDLAGAEILLRTARGFSPGNPYAAANLGVVYALVADGLHVDDETGRLDLLQLARDHVRDAVELRPGYGPYEQRLHEFEHAMRNPRTWSISP